MSTTATFRTHGNAYEIFILALTLMALGIMALLILPLSPATEDALRFYDNAICCFFLVDFAYNLTGARPKSGYFIGRRGWLDLLGSIPSLGFIPAAGLLRLARLSRLMRILRVLNAQRRRELVRDVLRNRGQYAGFITLFLAMLVLVSSSVAVLQFESTSPGANIKTGGDALWWSVVTITTVGYGDFYPVTTLGRMTATFVMFAGVGIIGALASILASLLVSSPDTSGNGTDAHPTEAVPAGPIPGADAPPSTLTSLEGEVRGLRAEIAALRDELRELASPDAARS